MLSADKRRAAAYTNTSAEQRRKPRYLSALEQLSRPAQPHSGHMRPALDSSPIEEERVERMLTAILDSFHFLTP